MSRPPSKRERLTSLVYGSGYAESIDGRAHTRVNRVRKTTGILWPTDDDSPADRAERIQMIRAELDRRIRLDMVRRGLLPPDAPVEAPAAPVRTLLHLQAEFDRDVLTDAPAGYAALFRKSFAKWLPTPLTAHVPLTDDAVRSYLIERARDPATHTVDSGGRWRSREGATVARSTQREYLKKLRALFAFARRRNYLTSDPTEAIELSTRQTVARRKGNDFTDREIAKIRTALDSQPSQYAALVWLVYLVGLRAHELVGLRFAERDASGTVHDGAGRVLSESDGYILPGVGLHIVGKGRERWVPLWTPEETDAGPVAAWQRELAGTLDELRQTAERDGRVMADRSPQRVQRTFLAARKAAGVTSSGRGMHDLRDTRARIWKARFGWADHFCARLLGHSERVHAEHYDATLPPEDVVELARR
jgi:integrase